MRPKVIKNKNNKQINKKQSGSDLHLYCWILSMEELKEERIEILFVCLFVCLFVVVVVVVVAAVVVVVVVWVGLS